MQRSLQRQKLFSVLTSRTLSETKILINWLCMADHKPEITEDRVASFNSAVVMPAISEWAKI